ncbi:anti-sigma-W factor RsiW [Virgibacillus dakarensis]|uniref:Anti-sigma-W factor RsiW n=1 Tax=Lentibacillus populi TaxID=1827502 RepID=A0A9W5X4V6_9BACI|nr:MULTISPECIES: anti-sigma-W factor RsiW [Bacillaceae]MBT2218510.1 anti-sigma-W factor RsiW [Virgibacillus dakarensis]MTW87515.1 anti-sigma-W factor RsiW [Virgibacillus dakarensis]GGB35507.1 anti-sigma-W factor RsiW [Lentibacillus populi]
MGCNHEAIELMHKYLDGDLTKTEEANLRLHLENCESCQQHFHELKRTITWIQSTERIEAPQDFTQKVMAKLPKERKRVSYKRWFKAHPIITAAAIFFILMFSGIFSAWNQDNQLVVSKQENLVIDGDTVIVPEGVTVSGDLLVKNGNLKIDGTVDGNVTLINGKLIDSSIDGKGLMASVGEVNGEFKQVDQVFEWIWYHLKNIFRSIFSFGEL